MARTAPQPALQLDMFGFDTAPAESSTKGLGQKRRILVGAHAIDYALRRSPRRTIGFLIDHDGLRVTAPRWVTLADIERAIGSKQRWIINKLEERQAAPPMQPAQRIEWRDGATLPYLGQPITLRLRRAAKAAIVFDNANRELTLVLTGDATEAKIQASTLKWLRQQATSVFAERLPIYASKLEVSYRAFGLSAAKTRWGSCNAHGTIRLNWRLIHLHQTLIDYVVAHELSHLREMNHSARFWAAVESAYPDYRAARQALRKQRMNALPII